MSQVMDKSQSPTVWELRRERERTEMMERIMDVARDLFVRDGYEALTLRRIALAIEYSPGTIYQYFKDKQALITAIIREDLWDLRENLLECVSLEDPRERLAEMARRYAIWGITHPNHYRLMFVPPPAWADQEDKLRRDEAPPLKQEALFVLYTAVKEGIQRGLFKEKYTDPSLVAATLWAGIHGAVLLEITMTAYDRTLIGEKDTRFEARFDTLKEVFLDGFLRDEPKAS